MVLHADLFVSSMDVALNFYCEKLGFLLVDDAVVRGPLIQYLSFGTHDTARLVLLRVSSIGAMIELQELRTSSIELAGSHSTSCDTPRLCGLISILTENIESHISRARSRGLEPASGVFTVALPRQGSCRVVFYEDPDGNRIEFLQTQHPDESARA
jgi:catechol 2,3-dioxygenase-like lactoylglutathione lyase family enzyme